MVCGKIRYATQRLIFHKVTFIIKFHYNKRQKVQINVRFNVFTKLNALLFIKWHITCL
jgi:hypothetical protein